MARSPTTDPRIGTELAGYRIEEVLGRGGMSVVYLAEDPQLKRKVALKLLAADLAEDERFREQFLRESQLAASIDHPNIVPIYEAGEIDGRLLYIAMRYVKGTDLGKVLARDGALEPRRTLAILGQVANALDSARFSQGLIHRDVKPGNILIGPAGVDESEHVYLADFGLTKHATDEVTMTEAGHFVGTLDYVAPEQIEGEAVSGATDVYSLGCVLYQCLTGEVPFQRDTKMALLWAHLEADPPSAAQRNAELPEGLDGMIATAMAKEPDERYGTCRELIEAARTELQVSEEVVAPVVSQPKSRWRWVALAAIAILVAAVAAVTVLLTTQGQERAAPTATPPPAAEAEATSEPADEAAAAEMSDVPVITTIAGTGEATFSGDGGPASEAGLAQPGSLAIDADGNIYVSDRNRVRRIDAAGIITTVAGAGPKGYSGDGGPATEATFAAFGPLPIAIDGAGNVYVSDNDNDRIRRIDASGIVTTIAGTGRTGSAGDGVPAVEADLARPLGIAVDEGRNVYFAEVNGHRIRKIDPDGVLTTIAGTGQVGFSGNQGPATEAELQFPTAVAVDASGNVYFTDSDNHVVRKVSTAGTITTVAGSGTPGYSGDGGRAFRGQLFRPQDLTLDSDGNLYIADAGNSVIRRVDRNGIITTIAGSGRVGDAGDGGLAIEAELNLIGGVGPIGLAIDGEGNLLIVDNGNNRVRKVTFSAAAESELASAASVEDGSVITTVAGNGESDFSGDGGPATEAGLVDPFDVEFDEVGNTYIVSQFDNRVRKVDPNGVITTVAGSGRRGFAGDGGLAIDAELNQPSAVAAGADGTVYIADHFNNRIRQVDREGIITTVAGTGEPAFGGDGGPATEAHLHLPVDVAVDGDGNLYIVEQNNRRVRRIASDGIITTVAGNGSRENTGDNGPATEAGFELPGAIAIDSGGNIYVADQEGDVIRKIDPAGVIRTVAGTGESGYSGDRGRAFNAQLWDPWGVAVDEGGNLFIADKGNDRIRRVDANGFITTVAGNGRPGYAGDGGPATAAELTNPFRIAVNRAGDLYIADLGNNRIRKVTFVEEP